MQESDIEELLRQNIDMVCDEEESMLIVGKQVRNAQLGRSDLTAIDNEGDIVLIEIKRDRRDIESRRESFEFQAIRYAASYATIREVDDLVNKVYAPYIEKYRHEFKGEAESLTSAELAARKLTEFLAENNAKEFNSKQKIILVASDFDEQTLSAVAWLNKNGVSISCYKLIPYKLNGETFMNIEKILPASDYDDYFVDLLHSSSPLSKRTKGAVTRRNLPRINDMLEWGVVKAGDVIQARGRDSEGTLLSNGNILVDERELSLALWLKGVYGWSSVQTYAFSVHKESGKTLSQIREEYMEHQAFQME